MVFKIFNFYLKEQEFGLQYGITCRYTTPNTISLLQPLDQVLFINLIKPLLTLKLFVKLYKSEDGYNKF